LVKQPKSIFCVTLPVLEIIFSKCLFLLLTLILPSPTMSIDNKKKNKKKAAENKQSLADITNVASHKSETSYPTTKHVVVIIPETKDE